MTYVVKEECIKYKLLDCVEVCPVDCFYEGKNMLVIKPDECIGCGVFMNLSAHLMQSSQILSPVWKNG